MKPLRSRYKLIGLKPCVEGLKLVVSQHVTGSIYRSWNNGLGVSKRHVARVGCKRAAVTSFFRITFWEMLTYFKKKFLNCNFYFFLVSLEKSSRGWKIDWEFASNRRVLCTHRGSLNTFIFLLYQFHFFILRMNKTCYQCSIHDAPKLKWEPNFFF